MVDATKSLLTVNPNLSKEWHKTKNADLTPQDVTAGSNRKVWWLCPEKHSYEATIDNRNLNGSGCPQCSKQRKSKYKIKV